MKVAVGMYKTLEAAQKAAHGWEELHAPETISIEDVGLWYVIWVPCDDEDGNYEDR